MCRYELAMRFIEHGASKTMCDRCGDTPLTTCLTVGKDQKMMAFLMEGVSREYINTKGMLGRTALHNAVAFPNDDTEFRELVSALLSAGADPMLKNNDGETPLDYVLNFDKRFYSDAIRCWFAEAVFKHVSTSCPVGLPKRRFLPKPP